MGLGGVWVCGKAICIYLFIYLFEGLLAYIRRH